MGTLGIFWRFVVLFLTGWFFAGFAGYGPRYIPNPEPWLIGSLFVSLGLAWAWQRWSADKRKRAMPD